MLRHYAVMHIENSVKCWELSPRQSAGIYLQDSHIRISAYGFKWELVDTALNDYRKDKAEA